MTEDDKFYRAAERRIEYLIVVIGVTAAVGATAVWNWRVGAGFACGAMLSWINYRWMKQGVDTLARLSNAQGTSEKPRIPTAVYVKSASRYVLLVAVGYVILRGFDFPAVSLVAGFFAAGTAAIVEMIGQLFRAGE